jgi:hypothetical protein
MKMTNDINISNINTITITTTTIIIPQSFLVL